LAETVPNEQTSLLHSSIFVSFYLSWLFLERKRKKEIRKMSRLNNIIKFVLLNMNILMCFIGFFFFVFAFYLWFANWGSLGKDFFIRFGFVSLLFGLALSILSCIGCQGINNQTRKFGGKGFWTGRKIVAVHLSLLILGLIGEIYVLKTALDATQRFDESYQSLSGSPATYPPYVSFESMIAQKFNDFFFGASSTCKSKFSFISCSFLS
jgi:hypothetical protein